MKKMRFAAPIVLGCLANAGPARGQVQPSQGCRRVLARRWDALLGRGYALVADCDHPERPARLVADGSPAENGLPQAQTPPPLRKPILVRAGETVRLWQRTETVRIEMSGVAEQTARDGETVGVRVTRRNGDAGTTAESIVGIVRGPGEVEMKP